MSLTNHIIIPIVGSKQNLQEQNIFVSSYFNLTPQKQEDMPDLSFWKKSMSAFKKFKQKKDKKDKKHALDTEQQEDNYLQGKRVFSKLVKRRSKEDGICSQLKYEQYLQSYKYYDPNDAPLYELQIQTNFQYKLKGIKPMPSRPQKIDQEIHQIKMVKIQSQINEQELPVQPIIQSRFDDPFIIIRKDNIKKNHKTIKSKPIKKDKHQLKHHQDKAQALPLHGISLKTKISNSHDLIKKQDLSQRNIANHVTHHQSHHGRGSKFQESENSSQENRSHQAPMKIKKQMHTLQQIFKQANEKNGFQQSKSMKHRQKLFNLNKNEQHSESGYLQ